MGLQDQGCELEALELLHPEPPRVEALLASLGFSSARPRVSVLKADRPALRAHIRTPRGLQVLGA
jgi:hypothetical protein